MIRPRRIDFNGDDVFSPGLGPETADKGGSSAPSVNDKAVCGAEPVVPQPGVCPGVPRLPDFGVFGLKNDTGFKDAGTPTTNPFKLTEGAVSEPVRVLPPCRSVRGGCFGQSLGRARGSVQVNSEYTSKVQQICELFGFNFREDL